MLSFLGFIPKVGILKLADLLKWLAYLSSSICQGELCKRVNLQTSDTLQYRPSSHIQHVQVFKFIQRKFLLLFYFIYLFIFWGIGIVVHDKL